MAQATLKFDDNSRFSVLGPNWSMRLNPLDKVPVGQLTLDGKIGDQPVRFFCRLDKHNTVYFDGQWEPIQPLGDDYYNTLYKVK